MPDFETSPVGDPVAPCPVPKLVNPRPGHVFLAGQTHPFETAPGDATVTATGQTVVERKLGIGAPGEIEITPIKDGEQGDPAPCEIVAAEVVEMHVVGSLPIDDAKPHVYSRDLAAEKWKHREVAALLMGEKLVMEVTLKTPKEITSPADIELVGEGEGVVLRGKATVSGLSRGFKVKVESEKPLGDRVQIHKPKIQWRIESEHSRADVAGPPTELHLYTSLRPAIQNVSGGRARVRLKHHYEMACQWAQGASKNIGQGPDSIAHNIDNQMRHYVHTKDEKGDIWATCTPGGGPPPVNYQDLPNSWRASSGDRGVSSLYYPPLEVKKPYEEYYPHYQYNFGWHLLDNPTHTGGRCNQQAALVCDIVGLFGIQATVHYLQRRGLGRRTGRPCRQYFYAAGGSGPWNFHGIVRVVLDDGGEWLYDGSFSSPPHRLNGELKWAESPGGPFIQKWHEPWTYEDTDGWSSVPPDDTPTSWEGIQ